MTNFEPAKVVRLSSAGPPIAISPDAADIEGMANSEGTLLKLARLETGLKVAGTASVLGVGLLAILMAVMVFQVEDAKEQVQLSEQRLASQIETLITKADDQASAFRSELSAFRTEMAAEARATRQELSGIATAIATGITAARQQPSPPASEPAPR